MRERGSRLRFRTNCRLRLRIGFLSKDFNETAKGEKLNFIPQQIEIKAPHFVMYVKDLLVQKYGETAEGGSGYPGKRDRKVHRGEHPIRGYLWVRWID